MSTEEQREEAITLATEQEDWLYDDGWDMDAATYRQKRAELAQVCGKGAVCWCLSKTEPWVGVCPGRFYCSPLNTFVCQDKGSPFLLKRSVSRLFLWSIPHVAKLSHVNNQELVRFIFL